jgi:hypothetical protein
LTAPRGARYWGRNTSFLARGELVWLGAGISRDEVLRTMFVKFEVAPTGMITGMTFGLPGDVRTLARKQARTTASPATR